VFQVTFLFLQNNENTMKHFKQAYLTPKANFHHFNGINQFLTPFFFCKIDEN
jgi:hypothetical protein